MTERKYIEGHVLAPLLRLSNSHTAAKRKKPGAFAPGFAASVNCADERGRSALGIPFGRAGIAL